MTDKKCDHEWDNEREICLKCAMYWDIFIQIEKAYANGRNDEETEWRTILLSEREKGLIDKGIKIGKAEQDKLIYCPVCRKIVIWSEVLKDVENGGMGMCDCEWSCNNRIYMEYLPVTKEFIQNIKAEACHMHSEEHFYGCLDKECHEWMEKVVKDIEETERNRILDEVEKLFTEWELLPHAYQELSALRGEQK